MNWYKQAAMPEGWKNEALVHLQRAVMSYFTPVSGPRDVSLQRPGEFFTEEGREIFFKPTKTRVREGEVRVYIWYNGNKHTALVRWKPDFSLYDSAVYTGDRIGYASGSAPWELLTKVKYVIEGFYRDPGDDWDISEPEPDPTPTEGIKEPQRDLVAV